jgi:hypothetical protein
MVLAGASVLAALVIAALVRVPGRADHGHLPDAAKAS